MPFEHTVHVPRRRHQRAAPARPDANTLNNADATTTGAATEADKVADADADADTGAGDDDDDDDDTYASSTTTSTTNDDDINGSKEGGNRRAYSFPSLRALQDLPVLNAVIWETLRLHPVVPSRLSRVAPAGGAPVDGVWVPAGTHVAVPPYVLQRTASVFPEPDAWNPARWLVRHSPASGATAAVSAAAAAAGDSSTATADAATATADTIADAYSVTSVGDRTDDRHDADGGTQSFTYWADRKRNAAAERNYDADDEKKENSTEVDDEEEDEGKARLPPLTADGTPEMRAHMLVFGRGARTCVGRAIGLAELRLVVAAVARRFARVRMPDTRQTDADMEMRDTAVLAPRGQRCVLAFEKE